MRRWIDSQELGYGGGGNDQTLPCGCPAPYPDSFTICVLGQPLAMVIPPEGVHLSCPAHPQGHHLYGPKVRC